MRPPTHYSPQTELDVHPGIRSVLIPYVERPLRPRLRMTFSLGRRCAHMSGLFARRIWPLASMKSATRAAKQRHAHVGAVVLSACLASGFRPVGSSSLSAPWSFRRAAVDHAGSSVVRLGQVAATGSIPVAHSGLLYSPPLVSRAKMMRAILLASATATTLAGCLASSPISHSGPLAPLRT